MKRFLIPAALAALLAACSDGPPRPAPGQAPMWPHPSPPYSNQAIPTPFTDTYIAPGQVQEMPAVPPGVDPPYAVRGQNLPTKKTAPEPLQNQ